jgi:hypothetical protein
MKGTSVEKKKDDWLDPKALGKGTTKADFDRNRDGIYGGLPEARLGSDIKDDDATKADFDRNRDGIYGGLPEVRLGLKIKDEGVPQVDLKRTAK